MKCIGEFGGELIFYENEILYAKERKFPIEIINSFRKTWRKQTFNEITIMLIGDSVKIGCLRDTKEKFKKLYNTLLKLKNE